MVEIVRRHEEPSAGPRPHAAAYDVVLPWWLRSSVGTLLGAVVLGIGWVSLWEVAPPADPVSSPRSQADRGDPVEVAWVSADDNDVDAEIVGASQQRPTSEVPVDDGLPVEPEIPLESFEPLEPLEPLEPFEPLDQQVEETATQEPAAAPAEAEAEADAATAAADTARVELRRARRADRELALLARSLPASMLAWANPLAPGYRITALFGASGAHWRTTHTGLDLAVPSGTPIRAAGGGTVTFAGEDGAYGLRVEVTHTDGTKTWYAHMSRIDVAEGTSVAAGATLGAVGATGNVTGPHLHLEVRLPGDRPTDPVAALRSRGVNLL